MTINDLTLSITEMTQQDSLALVLRHRASRRTPKKLPSETRPKKAENQLAIFALLDKEKQQEIIQLLTEKLKEEENH